MTTDLAAAAISILGGATDLKSYLRSVKNCNVDGVFSLDDLAPGVAECLLIPYLAVKRGF
jgi:hypothetical protein